MIQDWELIYLSKLIKKKRKNIEETNQKHNLKIQVRFIDKIINGRIKDYISVLEKELNMEGSKNGRINN